MILSDSQEDIFLEENADEAADFSSLMRKKEFTSSRDYKNLFQGVIHDLKNPLGNILGAVYLLETDPQLDNDKELLNMIKNSCNNALAILNHLLIKEKEQETAAREKVSVNNLIDECLADVTGNMALKNISILQYKGLADDLFILVDKQAVKRAFLNILTNAIKFSLKGGTIRISSEICENKLQISIEDQGIGIPQSQQPYIFEKFTSAQQTGTNGEAPSGLGLYLTRESILKNHGRIWFESVENEGTKFHIEFDLDTIAAV